MNRLLILNFLLATFFTLPAFSSHTRKETTAIRVVRKPVIDGSLNDLVWQNIPVATNFVQLDPDNGLPSSYKTEVKFIYTDNVLVVGVMMYDPEPSKILKELSKRDEINNSDFVSVTIDPFNNGLDAFEFIVTSAGVQWDAKVVNSNEDSSWDAVWKSGIEINQKGWSAELEIPYSALRFPSKEIHEWGVNVIRNIQRDREKVSWNFINKEEEGWINQSGVLKGIQNVNPPVRLSFTPYFSTYFENHSDESSWDVNYKGGMDLKYGINESFTLDMMLIPDFGQVQSDDEVLNLSPFEVKFDEKRQFFTEATELFNRGGVFYSRRIGGKPKGKSDVQDKLQGNEKIIENPIESKIINATKVSGRNDKGLGIGVLNAMSRRTYAKVQDTIAGKRRQIKTQPFTNYNMLVLDQSLNNESYLSFFNTNVYIPETEYLANVSGTEISLKNKLKTHRVEGKLNFSQRYEKTKNDEIGYLHEFVLERIKGKFTWNFYHTMISGNYNPNDLGFLYRNNKINNNLNFFYNVYKPKGRILQKHVNLRFHHESRYEPRRFSQFTIFYNGRLKFKSYTTIGVFGNVRPLHQYDYNEPRVDGMKLRKGSSAYAGLWFSSDYRKALAVDVEAGYGKRFSTDHFKTFSFEFKPRYRFNDRFVMDYNLEWERQLNELGCVDDEEVGGVTRVYIGERNASYLENRLSVNYIFNNKTSLSFKARHYWAKAEYERFYILQDDGRVADAIYNENEDVNFNSFAIDMVYSWRFAPGSELLVVWKNSISEEKEEVAHQFVNNLKNTFDASQFNQFSVKLLYYIDYMSLKRKG